VSEENVAFVRALFDGSDAQDKQALLDILPEAVPQAFTEDARWEEDPDRADQQVWEGHDGICASFRRWLDQWDDYSFELRDLEDHGEQVFVVMEERARGLSSGVDVTATNYLVLTFRDGKIARYQEFYDEQQARTAFDGAG
jgi:ketosteroid isomerase-like protein